MNPGGLYPGFITAAYAHPFDAPEESNREKMNLYEILRKLVACESWTQREREAALRVLDGLEARAALGTTTTDTESKVDE